METSYNISKDSNTEVLNISPYFSSYKSIEMILYSIKNSNILEKEVYLISTQSIPNFIKIINESKILEKFQWNNSILENQLKKLFKKYKLETNIKILYKYEECLSLIDKNQEINDFIIVDDNFINNMKINYPLINQMKVELKLDKKRSIMQINFPDSQKAINIQEKKIGFYKFKEKANKIEEKISIFNPKTIININKVKINNNIPINIKKVLNKNITYKYDIEENKKANLDSFTFSKINNQFGNNQNAELKIKKMNSSNQIEGKFFENTKENQNDKEKFTFNKINYLKKNYENYYENNFNNNSSKKNSIYNNENQNLILNENQIFLEFEDNNNKNLINNLNKNSYSKTLSNNAYIFNNNFKNNFTNKFNNNINNNYNNYNNFNNNLNMNYNNLNNNSFINNQINNFHNNNYNNDFSFQNNNQIKHNNNFKNNIIFINNNNNLCDNNINNFNSTSQLSSKIIDPNFSINNNYNQNYFRVNLNNIINNPNNLNFNNQNNFMSNNKYNSNNMIICNNKNLFNNKSNNNKISDNSFFSSNNVNKNNFNITPFENNYIYYSIKNYKKPPLIGLENIGNTCYMNAALQCLSNIMQLTDYFLINRHKFLNIKNNDNKIKISKAYSDVIYNLWNEKNKTRRYKPSYFKEIIGKENKNFEGNDPNDSKDLILFLYKKMHHELNEKSKNNKIEELDSNKTDAEKEYNIIKNRFSSRNKSIISDLFYFYQIFITKCQNCGALIYDFNIYNIFLFPLEKTRLYKARKQNNFENVNIFDCFECYTAEEKSKAKNKIFCKICQKKANYTICTKICSFPEILTIILNRGHNLEFDVEFQIHYIIDNLDKYMIKLDGNKEYQNLAYELIGIVIHTGESGKNGHFFTYCKSPVDRQWYSYNDTKVEFLKDPIEGIKGIPYLLFYQKITN